MLWQSTLQSASFIWPVSLLDLTESPILPFIIEKAPLDVRAHVVVLHKVSRLGMRSACAGLVGSLSSVYGERSRTYRGAARPSLTRE
jgi:hypothetical protein